MADSFKTVSAACAGMNGMTSHPDLQAAEQFLAGTGRILDQRRFEIVVRGGDPAHVRAAVAAYRNGDGGFGHALEPDCRCPDSQPAAVAMALRILDECGAWDPALVQGACDWLARHPAAAAAARPLSKPGWRAGRTRRGGCRWMAGPRRRSRPA